jgi:hypothetical protein
MASPNSRGRTRGAVKRLEGDDLITTTTSLFFTIFFLLLFFSYLTRPGDIGKRTSRVFEERYVRIMSLRDWDKEHVKIQARSLSPRDHVEFLRTFHRTIKLKKPENFEAIAATPANNN